MRVYLFEDDELRSSEDERHDPCEQDHSPSSSLRRGRQAGHRATDGQVAVNTHGGQQERRTGQRHDLLTVTTRRAKGKGKDVDLV